MTQWLWFKLYGPRHTGCITMHTATHMHASTLGRMEVAANRAKSCSFAYSVGVTSTLHVYVDRRLSSTMST